MSRLRENGSTLASIIGPFPEKLTGGGSFGLSAPMSLPAQFHKMFWGKSMADEEKKWRDAQPPVPVEEAGLGNERQGGDEPMDVDASEEEESDDDIIEGCYSLEIDIEDFQFPSIWIRAEYIRIYNALEARYRKPSYPYLAPAVVITGQPGIGKSVWIYYALRRRLAERKPVIWYLRETRYLFVEEGVYEVPDKFHDFKVFIWTLVDSDEAEKGVPNHLVTHLTRHFVIYCTSPSRHRWSRLHKTVRCYIFIMNPWKSKEILRVTSTLQPGTIPHETVNRVFNELGPTPRLCIDYLAGDGIEQYRKDVHKAISTLTPGELERLFEDSSSLTMDALSHKICLIRRKDKENMYSEAIVSPITPFINSRLTNHFRSLERGEQIRLYKYLSKVPDSRATAGIFFEAAGQGCLRDGVTLELLPMVRLPSSQPKNNPRWYSSHVFLHNETLEVARQQALQQRQLLIIPQGLRVEEYTDNGPSSIIRNVIYVPELTNQVALDSFILMKDLLYIFQFSIGRNHDIKPGLLDFIRKRPGFPSMDKCRFVFIHPPNLTLVCPQPRKLEMQELHPCSAALIL